MRSTCFPEVVALLRAEESTSRDAYDHVRLADTKHFGGPARHRFLCLQARLAWLRARTRLAEKLSEGELLPVYPGAEG